MTIVFGWDDKENDDDNNDADDADDDDDDGDVWMWTECLVGRRANGQNCVLLCVGLEHVVLNVLTRLEPKVYSTGQSAYISSDVWNDIVFFVDGQKIASPCGWL